MFNVRWYKTFQWPFTLMRSTSWRSSLYFPYRIRHKPNYSCCPGFCEKSNLRWRLAGNLAPCSCAATVEYTVHSCCVLIAKPDLPPQSIHRLELTHADLVEKSQLLWYILYITEMFIYTPLPRFHKIRDITFCFGFQIPQETLRNQSILFWHKYHLLYPAANHFSPPMQLLPPLPDRWHSKPAWSANCCWWYGQMKLSCRQSTDCHTPAE